MAKIESSLGGLVPALALVAGVFSATMLRPGTGEPNKPSTNARTKAATDQSDQGPGSMLADLRPVMELIGESLGISIDQNQTKRALRALRPDGKGAGQARADDVARAMSNLEPLLDSNQKRDASREHAWCESGSATAKTAAASAPLLDAYLRSEFSPDTASRKLQSQVAASFLEDLDNHQALCRLVAATQKATPPEFPEFDVQFLLATIPDYVDSNSGWVADETIGAIQSAMSHAGFVLDRFKLIDWVRADNTRPDGVATDSRLHERQPGALIFRKVDEATARRITFQVVLLVLETPTTGVHRKSLANAIDFIYRWSSTKDPNAPSTLRIVAPTFSGSIPSLALELKPWPRFFSSVSVVTGSAMADVNPAIVAAIAPGIKYEAAVQPTSAEMNALSGALGRMNPGWPSGEHVALLVESNTSFGQSAAPTGPKAMSAGQTACPSFPNVTISPGAFPCATVYRFPLHVSQLRSDATLSQPAPVSLLPTPIVPLSFRDTTPASDQLPALRPQLASSVAEATVDNILDNIRHEDLDVVGIVATDPRDVLFLAREVRKAAPDVQLFFVGSYLLYLQPEYIPYMRGALVASPYPLALGTQRTVGRTTDRDAFPSFVAAGVFNATSIQLQAANQLVDYCDPSVNFIGATPAPCRPPVWVTVIGNDGYWPLNYEPSGAPSDEQRAAAEVVHLAADALPPPHHQTPITTVAGLTAIALTLLVGGVVWASMYLFLGVLRPERKWRLPFLRAIARPATYHEVVTLHAFAVFLSALLLACFSCWIAKVLTIQLILQVGGPLFLVNVVAWTVFVLVLSPGMAVLWEAYRRDPTRPAIQAVAQAPLPSWNKAMVGVGSMLMLGTIWYFVRFLEATNYLSAPDAAPAAAFKASRLLAGGIISPLPATTLLFGALFVGMVAGVRRLSMVGRGYTALADHSPAFRLFTGAPREFPGSSFGTGATCDDERGTELRYFAALLDMPVQNLPKPYLVGVCTLIVAVVWILRGWLATIDGPAFSQFVTLATLSILVATALLAAQAASTWSSLKPKLARLAHARIAQTFGRIGHVVRWDLSITPPHLSELMALAARAETLRDGMIAIGNRRLSLKVKHSFPNRRTSQSVDVLTAWCASSLAVRPQDLAGLTHALSEHNTVGQLRDEIVVHRTAPLLQSEAWFGLWDVSDNLVTLLEQTHWQRCPEMLADAAPAPHADGLPRPTDSTAIATWFRECEEFVAIQYAFVVRDILARTMSPLFAAMLCLTLLAGAHLFYLFPGRSSLLTIDLFAMVVMAIVAIPIVIGMERDAALSLLRSGTPDRIDFSWDFAKRVALYGVLPMLAVIGSLFPEIGGSFFGWLEPLRKLAAF
jgi:hypothetical protein